MSVWQVINSSGYVLWILLFCSVAILGIIIERMVYFRLSRKITRHDLMNRISVEIEKKNNVAKAADFCENEDTPLSRVAKAGIDKFGSSPVRIENAMNRQIIVETARLERLIPVLGTIGSNAVYVGLLGTVIGIIYAFHDISQVGGGNISTVIGRISEALISTAAGICVAIPAVVSYNIFLRRLDAFISEMELCASECADILGSKTI
jgi:biopolymer transport protein ExbB